MEGTEMSLDGLVDVARGVISREIFVSEASRGTIARQHPYNYEMGLGRATDAFEDHGLRLPGRISDVTEANASENNQRGFYTRWQQFMEAKTWADLKR